MKNDLNSSEVGQYVILAILSVITVIATVIFIVMVVNIKEQRESILFLFLDIPTDQVKNLHRNCDKFLQNYVSVKELIEKNETNMEEEEEDENGDDDRKSALANSTANDSQLTQKEREEDDVAQSKNIKRKKIIKKYRQNKFNSSKDTIFKYVFVSILIIGFSFINLYAVLYQKS